MNDIEQLLESVSNDVLQRFQKSHKIKYFHVMNPLNNILAVNIIFRSKKDIERFQKNSGGLQSVLMDYLNTKLEAMGKQNEFDIQIELDSEEAQKDTAMRGKRKIPSEEDFARADAADAYDNRGLNELCENILKRFKNDKLHEFFVFYSPNTDSFYPYIFYRWEREVAEAEKSGLSSRIEDAVYEELEKVGRGKRGEIKVNFEFDSHENVEKNYEGNYYLRLR